MDAGFCDQMRRWGVVPSEVAKFAQVVTYNRAGLGFSERSPKLHTIQQTVDELHTLLSSAGIPGPFVLVGHSFGGLNMRLYASQHPDQVVGMVLIDAAHEEQYRRIAAVMPPERAEIYLRHEGGANCEGVNMLASEQLVHEAGPLPSIPVVVLSAEAYHGTDSVKRAKGQVQLELQSKLAEQLPNSRHIIVKETGHYIQLDQPASVIESIFAVVQSARKQLRRRLQPSSDATRLGAIYTSRSNRIAGAN
jgi:pimeloyl-ACP methyl ester carboxylesterase